MFLNLTQYYRTNDLKLVPLISFQFIYMDRIEKYNTHGVKSLLFFLIGEGGEIVSSELDTTPKSQYQRRWCVNCIF